VVVRHSEPVDIPSKHRYSNVVGIPFYETARLLDAAGVLADNG